jgi:hypothetical protein
MWGKISSINPFISKLYIKAQDNILSKYFLGMA